MAFPESGEAVTTIHTVTAEKAAATPQMPPRGTPQAIVLDAGCALACAQVRGDGFYPNMPRSQVSDNPGISDNMAQGHV